MNLTEALEHHLLDHVYAGLGRLGPIHFAITKYLVTMWLVGAFCALVLGYAAQARTRQAALLRAGVEGAIVYARAQMEPFFGRDTDAYIPYILSLFFFILASNLAGLLPYGATSTGDISVTGALALCTFVLIIFVGVRKQGVLGYLSHFVPSGTPKAIAPFLFVIEIFGLFAKSAALCVRLFANMIAGHIAAITFLSFIFLLGKSSLVMGLGVAPAAVGMALFTQALDVLIAILQAYIFALLTAVFAGMAAHPH